MSGLAETDVAVIGAGLAGLVAAGQLTRTGARVTLIDKGRRPGGRCATREVGGARCDSGAQFFTVRSDAFTDLLDRWRADGLPAVVWGHGWARGRHVEDGPSAAEEGGDGHPRHAVEGGMNALAAHLARDLDVRPSQRVVGLREAGDAWEIAVAAVGAGPRWALRAARVLFTPPLPQSLRLLDGAGVAVPAHVRGLASYAPTLALLLALDAPPAIPAPGGVQLGDGPVTWLGDNEAKGASSSPSLTVHAAPDFSRLLQDDRDAADRLTTLVAPWLGRARVRASELFRWRYAQPEGPSDDGAIDLGDGLVLAGDVLCGAKIEGAARSGLAAAELLRGG